MRGNNTIMNQYASKPIQSTSSLCYLFIIGTIFSSDILWVKVFTNQLYKSVAQYIYIFIVFIIIFAYYRRNHFKTKVSWESGFFIFTVLMLMSAFFITEDNINAYLFKIAMIIGGYYGAQLFSFEEFYHAFRRIMFILMLAAILLYVMKLTGVGYSALPEDHISTGVEFSTIGLANMYNNTFYRIPRATSIFWEPGVYAAYLNILLLLELFYHEKIDNKYVLLVLVSIALTTSTTGYIVLILILIAYILTRHTDQLRGKILIFILLAILILVITVNETFLYQLTSKVTDNSESFKNRWLSIAGNILVIKEAPLFGLGPTKSQIILESYIRSQGGVRSFNNLNTILGNYAMFGLLPFLYYVFHLIKFCFSLKSNLIVKILILIATTFLLSSTGYQYSPFFTLIFMFRLHDVVENGNSAQNFNIPIIQEE